GHCEEGDGAGRRRGRKGRGGREHGGQVFGRWDGHCFRDYSEARRALPRAAASGGMPGTHGPDGTLTEAGMAGLLPPVADNQPPTDKVAQMIEKTYTPAEIETRIAAAWEEARAFKAGRATRPGAKPYCIVIPPPNVTGSLHMGHALNNTLQDILCRF